MGARAKAYREIANPFAIGQPTLANMTLQEQMLSLANDYEQLATVLEQGLRITTTPR